MREIRERHGGVYRKRVELPRPCMTPIRKPEGRVGCDGAFERRRGGSHPVVVNESLSVQVRTERGERTRRHRTGECRVAANPRELTQERPREGVGENCEI